jgi:hypothetical protein
LARQKKIALLAALSNELENASAETASVIFEYVLENMIRRGLDFVALSSNAATAAAPAGLFFGAATPLPSAGGDAKAMIADLRNLASAIAASGISSENAVIVAATAQAEVMRATLSPKYERPIIVADNLAPGTVAMIASAGLAVAGDGGLPVTDVSKYGTLNFSDPALLIGVPGSPATVAAPTRDLFQTDSFALRCVSRISWAAMPGSVAVVNNASW